MALFKVLRGSSGSFHDDLSQFHNWTADGSATMVSNATVSLSPKFNDGFCYFLKDSRMFYIDYAIKDGNGNITERHRVPLNADDAQSIENTIVNRLEITDSDYEIPTAKLIKEEIARIDLLISQIGGDAIEALQNDKMDKEDPAGTGSFSMNGGKATGTNSVAWADASNAPEYTTASGYNAFAMGLGSTASGHLSFARGETAMASGDYSHADGYHVNATQSYTHAEGNNTTASAQGAHAEGEYTTASGQDAHAEGYYTEAQGKFSHAEGNYTTATHKSQHVEGEWNALDTSTNAATDRGTYVHITGIGTDESNRKNGFTVDWNGNLWGARSIAHGNNVSASGENSYAGGNTVVASGVSAHAEGSNNEARGSSSHTEGDSTYASSSYSHAEGKGSRATNQAAHAEGYETQASGYWSHAEGYQTRATNDTSHAEGSLTIASGRFSHAEGEGTAAQGYSSHAEGVGAKNTKLKVAAAAGATSITVEETPTDLGLKYIVLGGEILEISSINSNGVVSLVTALRFDHSVGKDVFFSGAFATGSHVEGKSNTTIGSNAHAEGWVTTASGQQAHTEGYRTLASGNNSHAEGYMTQATGNGAHAEGNQTRSFGNNAHTEGEGSQADSVAGHAEGIRTWVSSDAGDAGHAEGKNTYVYAECGHAEGYLTNVIHDASYAHAEGVNTTAGNVAAHAEGDYTIASGNASHSEGGQTTAKGDYAHSEGYATEAIGNSAHSEGKLTSATGDYSHSGGYSSLASGQTSYTQGRNTVASGSNSFASGSYTIAKGLNSFATGQGNYKVFYFTGAANSTTYTISDSVSIDYEYIQGLEISGSGIRQDPIPPGSSITIMQSSDNEEYYDYRTVNDTKIYTLNPGYTFFFGGDCSNACLFEEKHPLNGGTFVQFYDIRSGVFIDRTAATSVAYLTVKAAEVTWSTHMSYVQPMFDDGGNIMYWQARYDWHQEDILEFSTEALYFVPTSSNIPSGSYVSSSYSGLAQIKSQSGSTITLSKTLSSEDIVNVSHYVILSDRCASGNYSFIAGCKNKASGSYTTSLGYNNTSSGTAAFTVGENNTASATDSFAIGSHTTASGAQSFATGLYTTASGAQQVVFGKYNATDANAALIIGNGTSTSNKKNAFTVSKTGVVYAASRLNIAGLDLEQDAAGYTLFVNGPAFFSGTVKAAEPIEANDLTTKNYVDNNLPRMTHSWITATAGQSVFDFAAPDSGCVAAADLADYYYIYFNGLLLIPNLHYSVSGSVVTFIGWAAEAGDVCHIVGFKPINPTA